jgi:hypothetical protein
MEISCKDGKVQGGTALKYTSISKYFFKGYPLPLPLPVSLSQQPPRAKALYSMRKLPYKFSSLAFAFYMATIIAFMMCLLLTAINTGVDTQFIQRVLSTYVIAMPVAFACVVLVRPLVLYLVSKTVATNAGDT